MCPADPTDHSQRDRHYSIPTGGLRSVRQRHGKQRRAAANQPIAHPSAGDLGDRVLPELYHHHDPQLPLRTSGHMDYRHG